MEQRPEEFFVECVRRGLGLQEQSLSAAEEAFLLMPLPEIPERSPLPPDRAFRLHDRWLGALSRAYAHDLRRALLAGPASGQGPEPWAAARPGEDWREQLRLLAGGAGVGITAVAEDWYARHGRGLEQRAMTADGAIDSGFSVPPPLQW